MMAPKGRKRGSQNPLRGLSLREVGVTLATRRRYESRIQEFMRYLRRERRRLPEGVEEFDEVVSEYVEHLWSRNAPEASAVEFLSATFRLLPQTRRNLPITSFLVANWRGAWAEPFTPEVVRAVAGVAIMRSDIAFAAGILAG